MMLVEKIPTKHFRRVVTPGGWSVAVTVRIRTSVGSVFDASWFAFPPVSCRLRHHDGYRNADRACASGFAAARSRIGERF